MVLGGGLLAGMKVMKRRKEESECGLREERRAWRGSCSDEAFFVVR